MPAPEPPEVVQFYADPGEAFEGDEVFMCYGATGADTVAIEPWIRDIPPSRNRCFKFAPEKTTIYTFTATNTVGEASRQIAIRVNPSTPPLTGSPIRLFVASSYEVAPGTEVSICYSLLDVDGVRLDPPPPTEIDLHSLCFVIRPAETVTYTLTVLDFDGKTWSRTLTVTIR